MNIVILHGTYGHPKENWFWWLKEKLEDQGHTVQIPQLPTPENQSLKGWRAALREQVPNIEDIEIFIGHSCGATFLLDVLENRKTPVRKSIFTAFAFGPIPSDNEIHELVKPFWDRSFNWEKIKENKGKAIIIHGDNDPYCPLDQAKGVSEKIEEDLKIMPGAGHINETAGFTEFHEILPFLKS